MPVIQREFSRRPPSQEDEYFYELERRKQELVVEERTVPGAEKGPTTVIKTSESEPPSGFWRRLYRALTNHFNVRWAP